MKFKPMIIDFRYYLVFFFRYMEANRPSVSLYFTAEDLAGEVIVIKTALRY